MNIEKTIVNVTKETKNLEKTQANNESSVKFSEELKDLELSKKTEKQDKKTENEDSNQKLQEKELKSSKELVQQSVKQDDILLKNSTLLSTQNQLPMSELNKEKENLQVQDEMLGLNKESNLLFDKDLNIALKGLNNIVEKFNQSDDNKDDLVKDFETYTDNNDMINKDYKIQEKDILPQMNSNMNFGGDGQPFSSFMNNSSEQNSGNKLSSSIKDLAEESAIMSTMAENIAIANRNTLNQGKEREVVDETGIKKVDVKTGIKIETIVKYDAIIMNQADVEVFAELVQKGEVNLNNMAPQAAEKAVQVSKTLADMLVKSMETNQPIRIDFDNDISVIIKISRDGKITADFLPSSQIAEAYLKENLPLLRQKFEDSNIDYDSLNQRERREQNKDKQNKERSQR